MAFNKMATLLAFLSLPAMAMGQGATDIYNMSRTELRGTARYMSMAGAFGALGGDISAIDLNPGGIGVYRSSDLCFTLDLDAQSAKTSEGSSSVSKSQTKFECNNVGYVGAYHFDTGSLRNVNWGLVYSRPVSFNRRYRGNFNSLKTSLSNYVANTTNAESWTTDELDDSEHYSYNPYYESNAPWMSILAYNNFLINPTGSSHFSGLFDDSSSATGTYEVIEEGYVDQFSFTFGGNFSNILYWGVALGVTHIDYNSTTYYGEVVSDASIAVVEDGSDTGETTEGTASYGVATDLKTFGDGYNFKAGVIIRPINELRIGVAVHTPTYYSLTDQTVTYTSGTFTPNSTALESYSTSGATNDGYFDETDYRIRTPWKYILSVAAVIGSKGIISFDYECQDYSSIQYRTDNGYRDPDIKTDISNYYKAMSIFRIGGEYRITPGLSVRAGYSYQNSPVKHSAYSGDEIIYTVSTTPAYTFDKSTQYLTCGLGYRYDYFYADIAYVHKVKKGEYHAFTAYDDEPSPTATLKSTSNRFALTMGIRF